MLVKEAPGILYVACETLGFYCFICYLGVILNIYFDSMTEIKWPRIHLKACGGQPDNFDILLQSRVSNVGTENK